MPGRCGLYSSPVTALPVSGVGRGRHEGTRRPMRAPLHAYERSETWQESSLMLHPTKSVTDGYPLATWYSHSRSALVASTSPRL